MIKQGKRHVGEMDKTDAANNISPRRSSRPVKPNTRYGGPAWTK